MGQVRLGVVSRIDLEEEHGIIMDENCQDIFFSLKEFQDRLELNAKVSFEIEFGDYGLMAVNIRPANNN